MKKNKLYSIISIVIIFIIVLLLMKKECKKKQGSKVIVEPFGSTYHSQNTLKAKVLEVYKKTNDTYTKLEDSMWVKFGLDLKYKEFIRCLIDIYNYHNYKKDNYDIDDIDIPLYRYLFDKIEEDGDKKKDIFEIILMNSSDRNKFILYKDKPFNEIIDSYYSYSSIKLDDYNFKLGLFQQMSYAHSKMVLNDHNNVPSYCNAFDDISIAKTYEENNEIIDNNNMNDTICFADNYAQTSHYAYKFILHRTYNYTDADGLLFKYSWTKSKREKYIELTEKYSSAFYNMIIWYFDNDETPDPNTRIIEILNLIKANVN